MNIQLAFCNIVPFRPTRSSNSHSRFVNYFITVVPEGQEVSPDSSDVIAITSRISSSSQSQDNDSSVLTVIDAVSLPITFANGKKIVSNNKGGFYDIDKLEYYDGVELKAIERAILHYRCYIFSISAFLERFEQSPVYFLKEVEVILLCIKRGWKDLSLTSFDNIAYRLKHVNGISLIVGGYSYNICLLTIYM